MHVDNSSQSLHYFNIYSVLDRIDFRSLSCDTSALDMAEVDTNQFLPSASAMEAITANLGVLISRLLVKYIPALSEYSACVPTHIDHHKYSREMSAKSHVVSSSNYNVIIVLWFVLTGIHDLFYTYTTVGTIRCDLEK